MRTTIAAAALCVLGLGPGLSTGASAQELLGSYIADIGPADLRNSQGVRLWAPWQILRQDRANFHRFGLRDAGDEWDPFFADPGRRATMERMIQRGWIDPEAARAIVRGGVRVYVAVYSYGAQGEMVTVDVWR
ncbi:hypothetical protein [Actibacterium sp. MT2.3-13A]|uniref:hypothetical protein n=1 Tax=Actibacterium sp. MT2.3-13A TaxID=2828332 RepID=UPI002010E469|nr:hypothetical protein [Actibacterium sp. MT2.3-13A]